MEAIKRKLEPVKSSTHELRWEGCDLPALIESRNSIDFRMDKEGLANWTKQWRMLLIQLKMFVFLVQKEELGRIANLKINKI